jgi:hypothetical protein
MNRLAIDFSTARAAGEQAGNACLEKAKRVDPDFAQKAAAAILAHLRACGSASGEELTDIAIAHGARCHDQRAFGSVFSTLARKGLIRTVGFCLRSKGHSTAGGRVWGICQ